MYAYLIMPQNMKHKFVKISHLYHSIIVNFPHKRMVPIIFMIHIEHFMIHTNKNKVFCMVLSFCLKKSLIKKNLKCSIGVEYIIGVIHRLVFFIRKMVKNIHWINNTDKNSPTNLQKNKKIYSYWCFVFVFFRKFPKFRDFYIS